MDHAGARGRAGDRVSRGVLVKITGIDKSLIPWRVVLACGHRGRYYVNRAGTRPFTWYRCRHCRPPKPVTDDRPRAPSQGRRVTHRWSHGG